MEGQFKKELANYFLQGVYETISTMTGFTLFEKNTDVPEKECFEISGAMFVSGSQNAFVVISTKINYASVIVAYMTGIDKDEQNESMLYDALAEMVNMVAGQAKAKLNDIGHSLKLSSPFTIVGSDIKLIIKNHVEKYEHILSSDEVELKLSVYYI